MAGEDKVFRLPPIVRPKEPVFAKDLNAIRTALGDLAQMVIARTPQSSPDIGHRWGPGGFSMFLKRRGIGKGSLRFKPSEADGKLTIGLGVVCSFVAESGHGRKDPHYPKIGSVTIDTDPPPAFDLSEYDAGTAYIVVVRVKPENSRLEIFPEDESIDEDNDTLLKIATFRLDAEGVLQDLDHIFTSDILLPRPTGQIESSSSGGTESSSGDAGAGSGSEPELSSDSSDPTPDCDFDYPPPEFGWCTTNPTTISCPPDPLKRTSPVRCIDWETLVPADYREVGCINFYLSIRITGGYYMTLNNPEDNTAARNEPIEDRAIIELKGVSLSDRGYCNFQQQIFTPCTYHDVIFEVFSEYDSGDGSVPEPAHPCCGLLGRWKYRFQNPNCEGKPCTPGVVIVPP